MAAHSKLKQFVKKIYHWPVILLLVIFFATATTGHWILNSSSGLQWFMSSISRISSGAIAFEGVQGRFSTMRVSTLHFTNDDMQLVIHDLELNWQPNQLFSRKLLINHVSAQSIAFYSFSSDEQDAPAELPEDLHLPIAVTIQKLAVRSFSFYSEKGNNPDFVVHDLTMQLGSNGRHHQLTHLDMYSKFGAFKLSAEIEGQRPFNLFAQASLKNPHEWGEFKSNLSGNLKQIDIEINSNGSGITGDINAQLKPYEPIPVESISVSLDRFNPAAFSAEIPNVHLSVLAEFNKDVAQQLVGEITLSNHSIAPFDADGLPLSTAETQVQLSDDSLQFTDISVHLPDEGIISGNISWNLEHASGLAALNVSNLNPLVIDSRLRAAQVSGHMTFAGDAKSQDVIVQLFDDKLKLDTQLTHSDKVLTLNSFHLSHGQSRLTGQGMLDFANEQSYNLTTKLEQFNLSDFIQGPASDLNAVINLAGNLSPQLTGTLNYTINKSHLAKHAVSGNGQIIFNGLTQLTSNAKFNVGSNHFHLHGAYGEVDQPGKNLQLDITAPSLDQIGFGFSGSLNAALTLDGSLESPEISIDVQSKDLELPSDHKIERLAAKGEFADDVISLQLDAANFATENTIQVQRLELNIAGQKSKHQIKSEVQINDETTVQLHASGGVKPTSASDSDMQWLGKLSQLSVTGLIPVQLRTPTPLEYSAQRVALGAAQFSISGGQANINEAIWTPQHWQSQGNFTGIAVHYGDGLVAQEDMLHLGGNWRFVSRTQLDGNLNITREKGDWYTPGAFPLPLGIQTLQLITLAEKGEISSQFEFISHQIGRVNAHLTLPIAQSDENWSIAENAPLKGKILINSKDLSWIDLLMDDNIKSNGQLEMQADIAGTLNEPALQGDIKGKNLALSLLDQGLQLEDGSLLAHFDQSNIHINQLNFSAPFESPPKDRLLSKVTLENKPGSLSITGKIGMSVNEHHVEVKLAQLPFSHPSHYWILLSGEGHAKIQNSLLNLNGKIIADAGLIMQPPAGRPELADDIIIGEEPSNKQQASLMNIDATLDLGKQFYLRASGLEGQLSGQLHASNDARQALRVTGSIATKKATFKAYGQSLKVKRGIVNFHGPLDDPGLNVLAIRAGVELPVEAGVEVIGSVRHPKVRLVSEPNVPDSEKLSWVVLGRPLGAGGVDSALLLTAAGSIFGSSSGGITQQLSDALGVDEISFRQGETGNPLGSQIGTIGKRLSSRAYISYERGLTNTTAGVTKLTYSLTPKITVVTQAGLDSAVDMFYTFRFD